MQVIKDRNAGNSYNTYWKGKADREYCIELGMDQFLRMQYARDSKGRVRRFSTRQSAQIALDKLKNEQ